MLPRGREPDETEHSRETQVIPNEPEGPLGSMSAILSRANIDLGPGPGEGGDEGHGPQAGTDDDSKADGNGKPSKSSTKRHDATRFPR